MTRTGSSKRVPDRHAAILDAVIDILEDVGYERLSFDGVAFEASASRATIYRHWPTKPQLVSAALERSMPRSEPDIDTGTLRGDLCALIQAHGRRDADRKAQLVAGLVRAARQDRTLLDLMKENVLNIDDTSGLQPALDRAVLRGELSGKPDAQLLTEVAASLIYMRTLVLAGRLDETYVERMVDRVLIPVARHSTGAVSSSTELRPAPVADARGLP